MFLPDVAKTESFVDAEIAHDSLVAPSVEDGYMTRQQLIVARWITDFCYKNSERENRGDQWEQYLPAAFEAATSLFNVTAGEAHDAWEKAKDVRARNIPGFAEMRKEFGEEREDSLE